MSESLPQLFVDDFDPGSSSASVEYTGPWVHKGEHSPTALFLDLDQSWSQADGDASLSLSVTFQGTGIRLVGHTNCTFDASIDPGTINGTTDVPSQQMASEVLFEQHYLLPGNHTVGLHNFSSNCTTFYEFAPVDPDPNTLLMAQPLFVQPQDSALVFLPIGDSWSKDFTTGRMITKRPGDSVTYSFAGDTITVIGHWDGKQTGNMSLSFTIDDETPVIRHYTGGQYKAYYGKYFNFFSTNLQQINGNSVHNITVRLEDLQGEQSLLFGGFIYSSSFGTIKDMPTTITPISKSSTHSSSNISDKVRMTGAIVGGVMGFLALVAAILVFLVRRKWRRRRQEAGAPVSFQETNPRPSPQVNKGFSYDEKTIPQEAPRLPNLLPIRTFLRSYSPSTSQRETRQLGLSVYPSKESQRGYMSDSHSHSGSLSGIAVSTPSSVIFSAPCRDKGKKRASFFSHRTASSFWFGRGTARSAASNADDSSNDIQHVRKLEPVRRSDEKGSWQLVG